MMAEIEWFIAVDQAHEGPFSLRDLDVKFRTNELNSRTRIWRDGMQNWSEAFKVPEVAELL